jgi:predicted nucleotidyltransferase
LYETYVKRSMKTDTTARGGLTLDQLRQRREDVLRVAAAHGAFNVRVFGSVARGRAESSSDVDLLVDVTTDADGFTYFGVLEELRRALENLLGCRVDVVELRDPFSPRGQRMAERIREEAVPL